MDDIVEEIAALRKRIATEYQDEDAVITLNRVLAKIAALRASLRECADDLAAEIEASITPAMRAYPIGERRYQRYMATVIKARALLDTATTERTTS